MTVHFVKRSALRFARRSRRLMRSGLRTANVLARSRTDEEMTQYRAFYSLGTKRRVAK